MSRNAGTRRAAVRWALLPMLLLSLALAAWTPVPVAAAGCTVTNTNDSGAGSLRACLASAVNGDTITITATGTITLTTATLSIFRSVSIVGPGAGQLTISGNNARIVLSVEANFNPVVSISGVTISGGNAGSASGITNYSTLTLTDVVVSGNVGTGLFGGGIASYDGDSLTVINSTITGNMTDGFGGGISNGVNGSLIVINSTISYNGALGGGGDGGGIANFGTATISGSVINGNSSGVATGGIANFSGSTLTVTNSTLSGNLGGAGGAAISNNGMASLRFVTVTDNTNIAMSANATGGIFSLDTDNDIALVGSIVVGNKATGAKKDCSTTASGTITSQGYNVVGSGTGCPSGGTADTTAATASGVLNATLADNGGPTLTHALIAGGPAVDRVPTASCATAAGVDQRNAARPVGAACDSGAFEFGGTPQVGVALTLTTVGNGAIERSPAGTGSGPFTYPKNTVVTLIPRPATGQAFTGWLVDGVYKGWANPLTFTMGDAHTVQATFAPVNAFDVPAPHPAYDEIVALAARGTIRGYSAAAFGADDGVQRAQMAALIARAMPAGPDTPPSVPASCLVAGSWDCEDWGNEFKDRNGLEANLWRNVGALQHYRVARGYDGAACAARNVPSPCFAPTAPVSYAETITFIARAMIAKGYWQLQTSAPQPYPGAPAVFAPEIATFHFYTQAAGGVPAPPSDWNAGATRGWFARALWQALNTYWGTDGILPDGRPAGGNTP